MKKFGILLIDFLLAVLCAYVLASLLHTQFVLHELVKIGVDIDLITRLETSARDLLGLLPAYGGTVALALLLGFSVVAILQWRTIKISRWLYPLAGAVAIGSALVLMHPIMDITLIAGTRSTLGKAMQALAGAAGGWVFMHQRNKHNVNGDSVVKSI